MDSFGCFATWRGLTSAVAGLRRSARDPVSSSTFFTPPPPLPWASDSLALAGEDEPQQQVVERVDFWCKARGAGAPTGECWASLAGDLLLLGGKDSGKVLCARLLARARISILAKTVVIAPSDNLDLSMKLDSVQEAEHWGSRIQAATTLWEDVSLRTEDLLADRQDLYQRLQQHQYLFQNQYLSPQAHLHEDFCESVVEHGAPQQGYREYLQEYQQYSPGDQQPLSPDQHHYWCEPAAEHQSVEHDWRYQGRDSVGARDASMRLSLSQGSCSEEDSDEGSCTEGSGSELVEVEDGQRWFREETPTDEDEELLQQSNLWKSPPPSSRVSLVSSHPASPKKLPPLRLSAVVEPDEAFHDAPRARLSSARSAHGAQEMAPTASTNSLIYSSCQSLPNNSCADSSGTDADADLDFEKYRVAQTDLRPASFQEMSPSRQGLRSTSYPSRCEGSLAEGELHAKLRQRRLLVERQIEEAVEKAPGGQVAEPSIEESVVACGSKFLADGEEQEIEEQQLDDQDIENEDEEQQLDVQGIGQEIEEHQFDNQDSEQEIEEHEVEEQGIEQDVECHEVEKLEVVEQAETQDVQEHEDDEHEAEEEMDDHQNQEKDVEDQKVEAQPVETDQVEAKEVEKQQAEEQEKQQVLPSVERENLKYQEVQDIIYVQEEDEDEEGHQEQRKVEEWEDSAVSEEMEVKEGRLDETWIEGDAEEDTGIDKDSGENEVTEQAAFSRCDASENGTQGNELAVESKEQSDEEHSDLEEWVEEQTARSSQLLELFQQEQTWMDQAADKLAERRMLNKQEAESIDLLEREDAEHQESLTDLEAWVGKLSEHYASGESLPLAEDDELQALRQKFNRRLSGSPASVGGDSEADKSISPARRQRQGTGPSIYKSVLSEQPETRKPRLSAPCVSHQSRKGWAV